MSKQRGSNPTEDWNEDFSPGQGLSINQLQHISSNVKLRPLLTLLFFLQNNPVCMTEAQIKKTAVNNLKPGCWVLPPDLLQLAKEHRAVSKLSSTETSYMLWDSSCSCSWSFLGNILFSVYSKVTFLNGSIHQAVRHISHIPTFHCN